MIATNNSSRLLRRAAVAAGGLAAAGVVVTVGLVTGVATSAGTVPSVQLVQSDTSATTTDTGTGSVDVPQNPQQGQPQGGSNGS